MLDDLFKSLRLKCRRGEVWLKQFLRKQDNDEKLAEYLTELSAHAAQDGVFTHPVLMNLMIPPTATTAASHLCPRFNLALAVWLINYVTEQGSVYSSHHLLEAGLLREANGGYLIIP